ncbi:ORF114 similar to AcMNPV ORF68 [Cydia pomonella granulovirus]|uniref:ORF114 n=2 Tax=Cydia pomonella granulosis virus TaxID=28289 RepID=A0A097P1L4_GVCP|nr:ORF114 similar to AcMNPV ORF68 [Cydia pomonella granulovirus]AAK70774.1 ORF114 similar to AcMNPV ORF68 [Cydia pomonella granulovirus]AIU36761.1 ORF114 [Cydia pomonella granulovirus]AIU37040.1 ORF114 [Cydia pomonella granulovirus]AIU37182.1 ORF114 [Cydia pomonella granulovirus]AIU37321.1 ORF114 [Cydia pomonella granulovirus]
MVIDSDALFDIMEKYNWQIVNRQYIEIVPNERESAWKNLLLLSLRSTPRAFRKNIRMATLEHFDFKQPIYYDLKRKQLGLSTMSVLEALDPPSNSVLDSSLISPSMIVSGLILIMLSYLVVEGMSK